MFMTAVLIVLAGCEKKSEIPAGAVDSATDSLVKDLNRASFQSVMSNDINLVSESGIGAVRLGMTLAEARNVLPEAVFTRSTDGEGVALVAVKLGNEDVMTVYADEENPESPIDWTKNISFIETFSPLCHTANGIHPQSFIHDVEKILGKTKVIQKSEIEQREYIEFANQPPDYTFRIDNSGIFKPDSTKTTLFSPDGKILSISLSSRP